MIAFVWERFERVRNFIVSEGFFFCFLDPDLLFEVFGFYE